MNLIIYEGIKENVTIELRYHGYSRVVEPHAYGRDKIGCGRVDEISLAVSLSCVIARSETTKQSFKDCFSANRGR